MPVRSLGDLSLKNITKASFKASLIAVAIASMPLVAGAAGLGQIRVLSGLGQPLQAEIQIQADAEELASLQARLASPDSFARANLAYSAAAASIQVSVDRVAGKPLLRLSSTRPVNDPFVELLVELDSSSGKVSRGYTFLLDPVDFAPDPSSTGVVQAPAAAPARTPVATGKPLAPLATSAPAAPAAQTEYQVRRGDTLTGIAAAHSRPDISLEQMVVALHRANPQAFDGGNMNRLRAGAVLAMPDEAVFDALSHGQARQEIRAQAADFNRYRSQLAASVQQASEPADAAAGQAGGGRIVARVEEARPAVSGDEVRVSRASGEGAGEAGAGANSARLQALEEELAARDRALEEANARLSQLEASIRDMQKLLELRSAALAQLQQEAGDGSLQPAPAAPVEPDLPDPLALTEPMIEDAPALPEPGTEGSAAESELAVLPDVAEPALPADIPTAEVVTDKAVEEMLPAEAVPTQSSSPVDVAAAEADAEPAAKPKRRARAAPPPPPTAEPSLIDTVLEDPTLLAAGGGILVLLLGYAGFKLRQRRQQEEETLPAPVPVHELPPTADGVFAATGGQSVDTAQSSIMHTDFGQTGLSAIDADEGVDPVAEADVYMAYGRDAQAEEILQDALKADPERKAIYLKLLEIYSQRRDQRQFELLATELFARTTGQGADWAKAAAMGRKLDPENLLYVEQHAADEISTEPGETQSAEFESPSAPLSPEPQPVVNELTDGQENPSAADPFAADNSELDHVASLAELDFTASQPFAVEEALEPSKSQMRDTWTVPGELRQFSGGDDGNNHALADAERTLAVLEELEQAEALEVPALDLESSGIDFELDLGEEAESISEPLPASSAPATAQDDGFGLDFDLPESPPAAAAATAEPALEQDLAFDLDLDPIAEQLEADPLPAAPPAETSGGLADSVDFDLPDLDLDATPMPAAEPAAVADAVLPELDLPEMTADPALTDSAVLDLEKTSFDSSMLDFDFDIDQPAAPAETATPGLDVTTFDLDLDGFDVGGAEEGGGPVSLEATQLGQLPADFDALDPGTLMGQGSETEVDTKLELARAYEDMGDHEGARELLEEVLNEGNEAQQQAAREVMGRLL